MTTTLLDQRGVHNAVKDTYSWIIANRMAFNEVQRAAVDTAKTSDFITLKDINDHIWYYGYNLDHDSWAVVSRYLRKYHKNLKRKLPLRKSGLDHYKLPELPNSYIIERN